MNNWFNEELQTMKREKIIKYLQAKVENTNQAWGEYKLIRNQFKVQIENNKNNYIKNRINNATNQKQMWTHIKNIVLNKSQNSTKPVIFDEIKYNYICDIVNKFNAYFIGAISSIRQSIGSAQYINRIEYRVSDVFKFRKININELESIVKCMINISDHERVSNILYLTTGM